jgi:hypothetical protein
MVVSKRVVQNYLSPFAFFIALFKLLMFSISFHGPLYSGIGVWCVSYSLNPLTGMDLFCDLLRIYKIVKAIVDVLSCGYIH